MKGRKGWQRRSGKKYHGAQKLQCKKEGKAAADLPLSAWLLDSALAGSFGSYILSQSNGALEQCRKATSYNVLLTASIEGHGTIIWDLKQVRVPMVMHSSDTAQYGSAAGPWQCEAWVLLFTSHRLFDLYLDFQIFSPTGKTPDVFICGVSPGNSIALLKMVWCKTAPQCSYQFLCGCKISCKLGN